MPPIPKLPPSCFSFEPSSSTEAKALYSAGIFFEDNN
jgi:hypothetical protein